jgi:two-component system, NarL family, nitrate/nitrite response regulator NarL
MSPLVRVVAADTQPLSRDAMARAVRQRPPLQLVGEATDAAGLRAAIAGSRPDVVVLDAAVLAGERGGLAGWLSADRVPARVIVIVPGGDASQGYRALAAGADGLLSRLATGEQLVDAVLRVANGETVIAGEAQTAVAAEIRLREIVPRPAVSAREREILELIAEGLSAPQIGRRLHLATPTVKSHLGHLYEKLGVSERAAAVAAAMRRGLLA